MGSPVNQILDSFIANIDFSQNVISAAYDAGSNSTNITVTSTYHLKKTMSITIDEVEDILVNSVLDNVINVTGDYLTASNVVIPPPYFFFGTPKQTNILLKDIQSVDKTPMIYLYQILQEKRIKTKNSVIDTEATIQLFFLDNSLIEWTTSAHYNNVIDRMRSLFEYVEENILKSVLFEGDLIDEVTLIDHANFGEFVKNEGYNNSIFDENYSGVEMRIKLPISKYVECVSEIIKILTPCLDALEFWQGLNLYDSNTVENKVEGGSDVAIQNTSVVYFDGTSNGKATVQHEAIPSVTDVEVYYSSDNITWVNTGAYNIAGDVLTIGYNGSTYEAGYYSLVTVIKNSNPILQFTLSENNTIESINRLDESQLSGFLFPGGVIVDNLIITDNKII